MTSFDWTMIAVLAGTYLACVLGGIVILALEARKPPRLTWTAGCPRLMRSCRSVSGLSLVVWAEGSGRDRIAESTQHRRLAWLM